MAGSRHRPANRYRFVVPPAQDSTQEEIRVTRLAAALFRHSGHPRGRSSSIPGGLPMASTSMASAFESTRESKADYLCSNNMTRLGIPTPSLLYIAKVQLCLTAHNYRCALIFLLARLTPIDVGPSTSDVNNSSLAPSAHSMSRNKI